MQPFSSVTDLNRGLRQGDFSSVELTKACLDRIRTNEVLNSFITVAEERALAQAEAADQRRAAGEAVPESRSGSRLFPKGPAEAWKR